MLRVHAFEGGRVQVGSLETEWALFILTDVYAVC